MIALHLNRLNLMGLSSNSCICPGGSSGERSEFESATQSKDNEEVERK